MNPNIFGALDRHRSGASTVRIHLGHATPGIFDILAAAYNGVFA